jgi:hypothetical protein
MQSVNAPFPISPGEELALSRAASFGEREVADVGFYQREGSAFLRENGRCGAANRKLPVSRSDQGQSRLIKVNQGRTSEAAERDGWRFDLQRRSGCIRVNPGDKTNWDGRITIWNLRGLWPRFTPFRKVTHS